MAERNENRAKYHSTPGRFERPPRQKGFAMRRKEIIVLLIVITAANIPLFMGTFSDGLIYLPDRVADGQWWRLFTHPFVHVSLYHLLLDGAAFLLLYAQLAEESLFKRIGYLLGIHLAVVLAVTYALPHVQAVGYCGLSGVAHGLMAVWCLERMGRRSLGRERLIAGVVFAGLLGKSIYEVMAGHAFFESTHFGDVGVPVVAAHLAGIIGAVAVYVSNLLARFTAELAENRAERSAKKYLTLRAARGRLNI